MIKAPVFYVGGLPFARPEEAIDFVRQASPALPFLPQLPRANPQEEPIGQILRGFQVGSWDEKASICLPLFLETFRGASRIKIQMAGPFTVASMLSTDFEEIAPQWLALATNILALCREHGLRSEIWLQVDEPIWSGARPLPGLYLQFLQLGRSLDKATRLGLHSCAPARPTVPPEALKLCHFFSFNFDKQAFGETEADGWREATAAGKQLVAGFSGAAEEAATVLGGGFPWADRNLWISAPCGLSERPGLRL